MKPRTFKSFETMLMARVRFNKHWMQCYEAYGPKHKDSKFVARAAYEESKGILDAYRKTHKKV